MPRQKFIARSIETLSHEELLVRLRAAEDVCLAYGWSASERRHSVRSRATYRLWNQWLDLAGGNQYASPEYHPHLSDEILERLAIEDQEIEDATLEKLKRFVVQKLP